jgi:CRISPR-associated protein Csh1
LGFIKAVSDLGSLNLGASLEPFVKFPLDREGKVLQIYLELVDATENKLDVLGVSQIGLADHKSNPEMKLKYLYRDRVGSAASWAFSPIYKMGKPKKNPEKNRESLVGKDGDWTKDTKSHFYKICNRLLLDYEKVGIFTEGSVDRIMADLEVKLEDILQKLGPQESYIFVFGTEQNGGFLYPGDIPAFVHYFEDKLKQSVIEIEDQQSLISCAICSEKVEETTTLSKIFKFSTPDKVNFLPGLEKKAHSITFPICSECFRNISAGRERIERLYCNKTIIPGIQIWVIPEVVGTFDHHQFNDFVVKKMEQLNIRESVKTLGDKREERYLSRLAKDGQGLIFHFLFMEKNKAQELIHLMVEDVPPERLAYLEAKWKEAMQSVFGKVKSGLTLDWAVKSLYDVILIRHAGKSEGDKIVMRDFTLKVLGKLLRGERLPIATFKSLITSRVSRLFYETTKWSDVKNSMLYAQVWVEYMVRVNQM